MDKKSRWRLPTAGEQPSQGAEEEEAGVVVATAIDAVVTEMEVMAVETVAVPVDVLVKTAEEVEDTVETETGDTGK